MANVIQKAVDIYLSGAFYFEKFIYINWEVTMKNNIKRLVIGLIIGSSIGITTIFASGVIKSAVFTNSKIYLNNKNIPISNSLASIVKEGSSGALTYAPVRELLENMGYNVNWDSSDSSIRLSPKVISSIDEFNSQTFPLVSAIYEEDAYLYAVGFNQSVLKYSGISKAFDWIWTTPRFVLPRMQAFDYDKNGEKELAVSLNIGSGTGIGIDELHIVKAKDNDLIDYKFIPEDYIKQISDNVSYKVINNNGKMLVNLLANKVNTSIDITDYAKEISAALSDIEFTYGNIIEFNPKEDGKIEMKAGLGIATEKHPDPFYLAELQANITFANDKFMLSDIKITAN